MTSNIIDKSSPISDAELRALLLEYRRANWQGIQLPEIQERIVDDLIGPGSEGPLREVAPYIQLSVSSRILDVGSGIGSLVVACHRRGLHAFGIEPDRIAQGSNLTSIQIARRRLPHGLFVSGVGEALPFPDTSFDLVTMNQVVEHVTDQQKVIREASRVVRTGGVVYIACPNYLRFYEPHYKMFWLPLMPKFLGRLYLRWRGRNPVMLDQLTYTTNSRLKKLLRSIGPGYTIVDLHAAEFLRKRASNSFAAASSRLVSKLTRLPLLGKVLLWMVLKYAAIAEGGCAMLLIRNSPS